MIHFQLLLNRKGGKDIWVKNLAKYFSTHNVNHVVYTTGTDNLSKFNTSNGPAIVLGLMRGSEVILDLFIQQKQKFYYFDNPYLWHGNRNTFKFSWKRFCKNSFAKNELEDLSKIDKKDIQRIHSNKLEEHLKSIKSWKKNGSYILVCPSSSRIMSRIEQRNITEKEWINKTVKTLKTYTDRPIIVKKKENNKNMKHYLNHNCFACVTYTSMAAIESLQEGIPVFCHPQSTAFPLSVCDLSKIEQPIYPDNRDQLTKTLLLNQFNKEDFLSGLAWNFVNRGENRDEY